MRIFFAALLTMFFSPFATAKVLVSFADVAERALDGVVNIRSTVYNANKDPGLDLYQFFLKGNIPPASDSHSIGSGVIIDSNGHIITNHHVIKDASTVKILFKNKQKRIAKIIGTDVKTDLALLKVQLPKGTRPVDLGDSDKLRVGDAVVAVGNPFGYGHTVTSGIISAKGRVIGTGPYDNFLQTDASIHPGNSGGPLLDIRGRVIGINTAVSAEGPGIGFAIPVNLAKSIIKDLKKYGKVHRPFMGVVGKNILSVDEIDETAGVYGVIITNLIVDSPAHKSGLKIGDLIMGVGKAKVHDMNRLAQIMTSYSPSDQVRLKVYSRGKGVKYLNINLSDMPDSSSLPIEKDLF